MRLLGLGALPLTLAAFVVLGLLLSLHRTRRSPPRVNVDDLASWLAVAGPGSEPRAQGRRFWGGLSLLFALATASLLLLALGEPARDEESAWSHHVLVIDCSPSMATLEGGTRRLELAKARARSVIDALGPRERVLLATAEGDLMPRTPFTSDRELLKQALFALEPGAGESDPGRTLASASALLAGRARPALTLFSDGALRAAASTRTTTRASTGIALRHEQVGSQRRNVALLRLAVRRQPEEPRQREALVWLHNAGAAPEQLTIRLSSAGRVLHEATLELPAGALVARAIAALPSELLELEAKLVLAGGADALPTDDTLRVRLPAGRPRRVLVISSDDRYLAAALELDPTLVPHFRPALPTDLSAVDLVLFDGVLPSTEVRLPALYLGPPPALGVFPLPRSGSLLRPTFEGERSEHPLLDGLALRDVNVSRATRTTLTSDDRALAWSADRTPLLIEGTRAGQPFYALTFDLRESDLALRPAFPLLLLRMLDRLAPPPPEQAVSERPLELPRGEGVPERAPAVEPGARLPISHVLAGAALALLVLGWVASARGRLS